MKPELSSHLRIHVVGAGGAGMSAIAEVLAAMGHEVSGSDLSPSATLDRLADRGVATYVGHAPEQVGGVDLVAVSTAVPLDDLEVVSARSSGVPVHSRAEVLAAVCGLRRTVAVSGTHGKTTTSSLLASALAAAGMRPSWIVGAPFGGHDTGARWDEGDWLVVEADESDGTFTVLPAELAVVTSVEADHLDHHGDLGGLVTAFDRFLAGASGGGLVCADDPIAAELGRRRAAASYGCAPESDYRLTDVRPSRSSVRFALARGPETLGNVAVGLPGLHNARNGAAAIAAAMMAGASFEGAAAGVAAVVGVARRFELRGERAGVSFVDDYAHHPGEVIAALAAAADGGWDRVVCVFQPHRYSRTAALWQEFGPAFDAADALFVTDVYAAGEAPVTGVSGRLVADAARAARPGRPVAYHPDRARLVAELRAGLRPGDLCLTLGAGDLTTLADELLSPTGAGS
ncbi:MAG: UDP-N-acetylmuramate--L-alanine ligase [Acidimicrobiales bacterium]